MRGITSHNQQEEGEERKWKRQGKKLNCLKKRFLSCINVKTGQLKMTTKTTICNSSSILYDSKYKNLRPPARRATKQDIKKLQGEAAGLPFDIISKIFYNGYRIKKGEILMTVELLQALLLILKTCLE